MKQTIQVAEAGYRFKLADALTKAFADREPADASLFAEWQALRGETISFQIAYTCGLVRSRFEGRFARFCFAKVRVESPIAGYLRMRDVKNIPCQYPAHPEADDNYLTKTPGLYPDRLSDLWEDSVMMLPGQWKSLWIDADIPADAIPGTYPVRVIFEDKDKGTPIASVETEVEILSPVLPAQTFPRTEWFYADCLADYYGVGVFSEEHWRILEAYIQTAVKRGITMILTPQFTPPLDTAVGRERTVVQLVGVSKTGEDYSFDFSKLERWISMCKRCGVQYFELSHLFSQWGAVAAPQVVGTVDGEEQTLFGWHTPASTGEYPRFLSQYLPQLTQKLEELGVADRCYFHISDEPNLKQLESYRAAYEVVASYLRDFKLMDALSDYEFYKHGLVQHPVCATNHIEPFLDHQVPGLWSYYCTAQGVDVSNRFIAMPAARTRVYGAQLFYHQIAGALHWGYNFYNGVDSLFRIDPLCDTDSGGAYPSGDPFLVYPKADGTPEESIRLMLLDQAMSDLRAFEYLASLIGRDKVCAMIDEVMGKPFTFREYPRAPKDRDALFALRLRVNDAIVKAKA